MEDILNLIISIIASFILGLACHSSYLHYREKYPDQVYPWDHAKKIVKDGVKKCLNGLRKDKANV